MTFLNKYSLQNIENYKSEINDTNENIINRYIITILEYIIQYNENIFLLNDNYKKKILKEGLISIYNIYKNLF